MITLVYTSLYTQQFSTKEVVIYPNLLRKYIIITNRQHLKFNWLDYVI